MFTKTNLPNGLRVVSHPMPGAKSVAVMVMLAAGSRYETAETNGIAHFAEHMFFKGTEKRPTAKDISAEVDGIGGEFNAFTSKEYTGYYIKCAAEHRALALDVLADQLLNSKFDAEEVERETRDPDQAHLRLGVRGLPTTHEDRYTMQVMGSILGGGMSSRLFTEVRERLGLAYYVFCHHQSYADTGTLFSQSGVDIKRIDLAVQTIVREFGKLVR